MKQKIISKDQGGNYIYYEMLKTKFVYRLQLKEFQYPRSIGWHKVNDKKQIDCSILFVDRKKEDHYHYATQGFGVNDKLMRYLAEKYGETKVVFNIKDEIMKSYIDVKEILAKGQYLTFSQQGFETQIFVKKSYLRLRSEHEHKAIWKTT